MKKENDETKEVTLEERLSNLKDTQESIKEQYIKMQGAIEFLESLIGENKTTDI